MLQVLGILTFACRTVLNGYHLTLYEHTLTQRISLSILQATIFSHISIGSVLTLSPTQAHLCAITVVPDDNDNFSSLEIKIR